MLVGSQSTRRLASPSLRLSVEEAVRLCSTAMGEVVQTQLCANVSETVRRRQQVAQEAQEFFSWLPEEWGVTLETAGPEHVLLYVQQHWLQEHKGTCCCALKPGICACALSK